MAAYSLDDISPRIDETAWIAESASVIGNVDMHASSSVWFGAVVRGDNEPITIGPRSNVQDGSVLHSDPGFPLTIGEGVTLGHQVMQELHYRRPCAGHRRQANPRRLHGDGRAG